MVIPDWPAPAAVRALVTTRGGTLPPLPATPVWLKQEHGTTVIDAACASGEPVADGSFARCAGVVCAVNIADCMPVFFADEKGAVVGVAHAGWRGLASGIIECALDELRVAPARMLAWLGPAIGPRAYEVGEDVRAAFLDSDPASGVSFRPNRPGHWLLDLYAVARQQLAARGVHRIFGGGFCTYSEPERFCSYRRDRTAERMAALIWLESPGP